MVGSGSLQPQPTEQINPTRTELDLKIDQGPTFHVADLEAIRRLLSVELAPQWYALGLSLVIEQRRKVLLVRLEQKVHSGERSVQSAI